MVLLSALTINKPGYTGPIDACTLPRYDRRFFRSNAEEEEDTSSHSSLERAAADWHGSLVEDPDEC